MLRVAAGYPLSYTQSDIGIKGKSSELLDLKTRPVQVLLLSQSVFKALLNCIIFIIERFQSVFFVSRYINFVHSVPKLYSYHNIEVIPNSTFCLDMNPISSYNNPPFISLTLSSLL